MVNDSGDKNNRRGEKGGALSPQMITAVAIPLEKKKKGKKSPVRYMRMNPSKNTKAQKSHISKMRCVCSCMYISHACGRKRHV